MTPDESLMTKEQLAKRLNVKPSWVYEATRNRFRVRNGEPFPVHRLGKQLRFAWSEVVEWLNREQHNMR